MKKMLSLLLTLALMLSFAPTAAAMGEGQGDPGTITAVEVPGTPRLDALDAGGRQKPVQPAYSAEDIVTVIVQLDAPSLMDYYNPANAASEGLTAGEAVSLYLSEPDVVAAGEQMLAQQAEILREIGGLQPSAFRSSRNAGIEVIAQWTNLINGMAIRVPYGTLSSIKKLDGVKRAYVEHVYEAPEPGKLEGAGSAGYSYDMVGLGAAWQAGYTGKGMLVAVLDTGLDLEYASFWDDKTDTNVTAIRRTHEAFREESFKTAFDDSELRYTREGMSTFLRSHPLKAHKLASSEAVNTVAYKNRKVPYAFDYAGDADPETGEIIRGDVNVYPGQGGNAHGTHVAGTAAGYVKTAEGEVKFSGVAPDAQLIIMKVFDDNGGGATTSAIMNALEDTLVLGADVVNLSLGSDNGYADDDTVQPEVYGKLEQAGLILMTSAGNSNISSGSNVRGDYNLARDPEFSMMSSPAVYSSNLSVASISNTVSSQMTLVWNDGTQDLTTAFTDPFDVAMKSTFAQDKVTGDGIEIIPAGHGSYEDYSKVGFNNGYSGGKTGIALVQRGGTDPSTGETLSFVDKIKNADSFTVVNSQGERYGVVAVIIYDNVESDELVNMSADGTSLTSAFISKAAGDAMVAAASAGKAPKLKYVNKEDQVGPSSNGYQMSSFTSWGAGPSLELKPEITAPGGNIYSSILDTTYKAGAGYYNDYTGAYGMMSGTSMAAPHMTGLGALVRQYVKNEHKAAAGVSEADLAGYLLVSTAVPQKQKEAGAQEGTYYSPRRQGAGLVNVAAAISTPAYITAGDHLVGKLELKDDPNWTGAYPISFDVHNMTNSPVIYNIQASVQRPDTKTEEGRTFILDSDVLIATANLGSVTVPANGSAKVSGTIQLTQEQIQSIRTLFPNGTYIEGFISLTSTSGGDTPVIGLPYLGFLGDWTAAPIFDSATWLDGDTTGVDPWEDGDYTWFPSVVGSAVINMGTVINWLNLGQNIFAPSSGNTQKVYHRDNLTVSPNGDGYLDVIDDFQLYQMRDARLIVVQVRDAATGELYFNDFSTFNTKSLYNAQQGAVIPTSVMYFTQDYWDGTDMEGNLLPSGTKCIYTITAYGDGEYPEKVEIDEIDHKVTNYWSVDPRVPSTEPTFNGRAMNKTGDVLEFPVVVDYVAPKLENNAVSVFVEDGRTYISGTVYDEDGALASVEIHPLVTRQYKDPSAPADPTVKPDMSNPFLSEMIYDAGLKTWSFKADVTEYSHKNESYPGENNYYDYTWTGAVYISCGDYGGNDRTYGIQVKEMAQPGKILLSQSSARLYPGSEFELSVVDNSGSSAALTRTSSNPAVATVDEFGKIVAIAPGQTEITVSNGASSAVCVVVVEARPTEVIDFDLSIGRFEGLKPDGSFTVQVTNLQPADVAIDPNNSSWLIYEDDEAWGGLVNVYQDSEDALSGRVELNYKVSPEETPIPAGTGHLDVTLNGVTRTMSFSWEDLYVTDSQDDLSPAAMMGEQTIYTTYGETATLQAKYRQTHDVVPVKLWTAVGAENYKLNSTDPAAGLILDGQPFATPDGEWSGKLVNMAGYALPDSIKIYIRYEGEYETEKPEYTYRTEYTYDPATGEIHVVAAPAGSSAIMVIRADGVVSEGAPAGTPSGNVYEMPEPTFGPFQWDYTDGLESVPGELVPTEVTEYGNATPAVAFTPSAPGVSYITARSEKTGYFVNFAVVCQGVKATRLSLSASDLEMNAGEAVQLLPELSPEPTLPKDQELIWTSFNPSVAQVDANGNVTAISAGYAYIRAALKTDTSVQSCCIVKVTGQTLPPTPPDPPTPPVVESYRISYELDGGSMLGGSSAPTSYTVSSSVQTLDVPNPVRSGYRFLGWTYTGQTAPAAAVTLPAFFTGDLVLTANWEWIRVPQPVIPDPEPDDTGSTPPPSSSKPETSQKPSQPTTQLPVTTGDSVESGTKVTETTAVLKPVTEGSTASAEVTPEIGAEIVSQAVRNNSETVVLAPTLSKDTTKAEVRIPASVAGEVASGTNAELRVETPIASATVSNDGLGVLAKMGGEITVTAEKAGDTVAVTIAVDGNQVDRVAGGVTVTIPQTNAGPGTVAMLVRDDGTTEVIRQSIAGRDGKSLTVPVDGSVKLVVKDNGKTFADVSATDWEANAVLFVSSHELMNGTGEGMFAPDAAMTRGMLVMVLHNLENNPNGGAAVNFPDVGDSDWYASAVKWAAENDIVRGYADGSFGAEKFITRQDLAVILYRYVGSPAVSASTLDFKDADNISGYAADAMRWAVSNGILNGKGDGILDPLGNATRAQVAQILLNFLSSGAASRR